MVIQFSLFVSSKPRCQAEFSYIESVLTKIPVHFKSQITSKIDVVKYYTIRFEVVGQLALVMQWVLRLYSNTRRLIFIKSPVILFCEDDYSSNTV